MHSENKIGLLELSEMNWGKSGHNFDSDFNDSGKFFFQGSFGCSIDFLSKEIDFIPDYIKIDVDGNEFKVIHGMKQLLQNKYIKSILVEIDISQKENSEIINANISDDKLILIIKLNEEYQIIVYDLKNGKQLYFFETK